MLLRKNPDIIQSGQQDELVLLNPHTGQYMSLSGTGALIWSMLDADAPITADALVAQLHATYDVDEQQLAHDLDHFVAELLEARLLTS